MSKARRCAMLGALTVAVIAAGAAGADEGFPLPGYWELQDTWVFVFHFHKSERKCFTAADIGNVLKGPSNAHYTCTYPQRQVGDGRLSLTGTCVETHGQVAQIKAEGSYEPTAFQLKAELRTRIAGIPLKGTGATVARRLSDTCPQEPPKGAARARG
jgi:hypothetical protein